MSAKFSIELESFHKISAIPNAWSRSQYLTLMTLMELDDGLEELTDAELKDMCLMSLNDLAPADAANVVLTSLFSDDVTPGKIDQLSHEMADDRLWEEYSDCQFHERFFNAYGLLREAFNGIFAQPTGVDFSITLHAKNASDLELLDTDLSANLVRLLSCGLDDNGLMHRLYEEQLNGDDFPQASGILWQIETLASEKHERKFKMISSSFWFGVLENYDSFDAILTPQS
ncbi:hypothetical protein [Marinomonas sp.]|uniref:hypothetical protein n=1 Tax=Marinomonas sp. TaxID=1904862 RepID=UPI003F978F58